MKTVEMRPAYEWTCEECGKDNYERSVIPELNDEDLQELKDEHGVNAWEAGFFQSYPDYVVCGQCGVCFATKGFPDVKETP